MGKKIGRLIFSLLALAFAAKAGADRPARLVIIDDDTGMMKKMVRKVGSFEMPWLKITDPDGGLEMIYALRDPNIKIAGITCAMGCSTTEVCMASLKKIEELTGRTDVPVFSGAQTPKDLGKPTDASRFIIETVMNNPGRVEIITTAPVTNIATAMMLEPRLAANWKMLHLATGEFGGKLGEWSDGAKFGRVTGYKDMNISVDDRAIKYVLEHGGDNLVIYPNEIMDDAVLTTADRNELKKAGTPLSKWVADEISPLTFLEQYGAGMGGLALHGVIAVAVAIDPALAEPPRQLRVKMEYQKRSGYYFALTNDPAVAAHPVYVKLRDPETIEKRLKERCK